MARTKSGCITCRIRRVKCDETRPECLRCQAGRRGCGYAAGRLPRRQLVDLVGGAAVPRHLTTALSASPEEITYFELFRHVTAPGSALFPSEFWQRDVMQLAQGEPALWHATVAVGALQASWHAELQGKPTGPSTRRAATHYGKALALARDLDCPTKLAALSLLLVATTNTLGRWAESQLHILANLRMPQPCHQDTLMRMDFQAMTYSDSDSPYPYAKTSALTDLDRILQGTTEEIQSYREASLRLFSLIRAYFLLDEGFLTGTLPQGPFLTRYQAFLRNLCAWERCMERFDHGEHGRNTSLRLYHAMLRMLVRTGSIGPETRFDACLGYFELIVSLAAALQATRSSIMSLEPGLIIPLYTTVHRCRHSALRHHALGMLRDLNNIEGNWRSAPAAGVVAKVVAVEEAGLGLATQVLQFEESPCVAWGAWSAANYDPPSTLNRTDVVVPEAHRVRDVCPMADLEGRRIDLRLLMCSPNDVDPCGPVREEVVYVGRDFLEVEEVVQEWHGDDEMADAPGEPAPLPTGAYQSTAWTLQGRINDRGEQAVQTTKDHKFRNENEAVLMAEINRRDAVSYYHKPTAVAQTVPAEAQSAPPVVNSAQERNSAQARQLFQNQPGHINRSITFGDRMTAADEVDEIDLDFEQ